MPGSERINCASSAISCSALMSALISASISAISSSSTAMRRPIRSAMARSSASLRRFFS